MEQMALRDPGDYGTYDIVPRDVEWPKFDDGSPVCIGDFAGGDSQACGHVKEIHFIGDGQFMFEFEEDEMRGWCDPCDQE